jgi:hypothetical protein
MGFSTFSKKGGTMNEQTNLQTDNPVNNMNFSVKDIETIFAEKIKELTKTQKAQEPTLPERVAELEFKIARLWKVLVDVTPSGTARISKEGKRIILGADGNNKLLQLK